MLKFDKVPGSNNCVEKKFKLGVRKYEEYKGVRFGNGDYALVVDVWLHRVDEDASGLTFEDWDPSADTDASEAPVPMIVNSSELRSVGFDLREVMPLQLETEAPQDQVISLVAGLLDDPDRAHRLRCMVLDESGLHIATFHSTLPESPTLW